MERLLTKGFCELTYLSDSHQGLYSLVTHLTWGRGDVHFCCGPLDRSKMAKTFKPNKPVSA